MAARRTRKDTKVDQAFEVAAWEARARVLQGLTDWLEMVNRHEPLISERELSALACLGMIYWSCGKGLDRDDVNKRVLELDKSIEVRRAERH